MADHRKADYHLASPEERQRVVDILQRNRDAMLRQRKVRNPAAFNKRVDAYIQGILQGRVFRGKEFEDLVKLFRQEPIV